MAGQFLLLNPSKRRKKRAAPKKRARRTARRSYARNPIATVRRRAPSRRRARRTVSRSYRRNPISFKGSSIVETLKNAGIGGAGALGVDLIYGQLGRFLPSNFMSKVSATGGINPMYYAGKAGVAIALGAFGGKFLGRSLASKLAAGSLTVMGYDVIKSLVPASFGLPLGYYTPGRVAGMGAYVNGKMRGLGYAGMKGYIPPSGSRDFQGSFESGRR